MTSQTFPYDCFGRDLHEGDVVRVGTMAECLAGGYRDCTVKKVNEDETVQLFRPYVHTNDFTYIGGVICYLGFEEFFVWPSTPVVMLRHSDIHGLRPEECRECRQVALLNRDGTCAACVVPASVRA